MNRRKKIIEKLKKKSKKVKARLHPKPKNPYVSKADRVENNSAEAGGEQVSES